MRTFLPFAVLVLCAAVPARAIDELSLPRADLGEIRDEAAALKESVETKELFAVREMKGKKVIDVRLKQLGTLFLFAATIDKGTGENGMFGATMAHTLVIYFKQIDPQRLQVMIKDPTKRADPGTPEARTIAQSYPDTVLATLPIVSTDGAKGTLTIEAAALFAQDVVRMDKQMQGAYRKPMRFMDKDSYIEKILSLPKNLEVDAVLNFMGVDPPGVPDGSPKQITMHYSISHLPSSEGFEPRKADPRVGYFQQSFQDLSNRGLKEREQPLVHYINRWHLEKSDPNAAVSDVKKPIVYWLDETIPHEYRPHVRAGILAWNAAFEAVGLRNAIVVKEVDKDMPAEERASFHPADASYNVVRWFMGDRTSMGVAPSRVNPFTGEVFNTSIRLGDQLTRLTDRLTAVMSPSSGFHEHDASCSHWQAVQHAADALTLAETQGPLSLDERRRFMGQLLAQLTAHEAGHTLGLRHNFEGGALHPLAQAGAGGIVGSSFMHYTPPNIGADGKPRSGVYYQTEAGPYDKWAIEYGYKPLGPGDKDAQLAAVAARAASDPQLKYCTDEDAVGTGGVNPNCQRFMLGRDVVAFARQRTQLAQDALARLQAQAPVGDEGYVRRREAFSTALGVQAQAVGLVLPAIGGVRVNRVLPGMPGKPLEAVSAAEQREALRFLDEKVFSSSSFQFSPELMQSLQADRLAGRYKPNEAYPLVERVLDIQREALKHVMDRETLSRLADTSLAGPQAIVPGEVLMTVRRSVWKEIERGAAASIDPMRRNLQREHLKMTAELLNKPGVPGDAAAQARRDLTAIVINARQAVGDRSLDEQSRAHLEDMARLANEALTGRAYRPSTAVGK